jgi:hypothetical protein
MTTATSDVLSPTELRARLAELLELATKYAALESTIESKAMDLETSDWEFSEERFPRFVNAVSGELRGVFEGARAPEKRPSETDAFDLCQSIQDAIEILDFAIERSGGGGESDAR